MRPARLLTATLAVVAIAAIPLAAPASAAESGVTASAAESGVTAQTSTTSRREGARTQLQADQLAALKARAKVEIDRRLATLAELDRRIHGARHLSGQDRR